ncbi:hypothetical protein Fmac_014122 [Flemingia macrophylla]|uniref:Uncharacterized protein n=1 Tax=Flemingia macrophylla TaxID=520843 RepID=A0ABD1MAV5_9FABA
MNPKGYIVAMTFEVTFIGFKNGASNIIHPFEQPTPSPAVLLFLVALFPHVIATMLDMGRRATIVTFHVSGVVGCEALLHICLDNSFWYCIINLVFLLLIVSFYLFHYAKHVLLRLFDRITTAVPSDALPMLNMEPHPHRSNV